MAPAFVASTEKLLIFIYKLKKKKNYVFFLF